jgi:hypothetical protein
MTGNCAAFLLFWKAANVVDHRSYINMSGPSPRATPLLMNAGGLYNSDYTQPFENPKNAPSP